MSRRLSPERQLADCANLSRQPIPFNAPDPCERYGVVYMHPSIPTPFADRNRRFLPYPPNAAPSDLFAVARNTCTVPGYRFIRKNDQRQMLMFCDGACSNNGKAQARGGCGVALTCKDAGGGVDIPLEDNGTDQTSNRAELRAVILALGLRAWYGEGFQSVVIAMDSEYVILGITERIHRWIERGWKTAAGRPVANKDLWEVLLKRLRDLEEKGCHVQFWQIPREWNEADKYAKKAALENTNPPTGEGLIEVRWLGDYKLHA